MERIGAKLEQEVVGQGIFVGRYDHTLDPKKRLTIPSVWRAQVGEPKGLYVMPDVDEKCLCCFSANEMVRRLDNLQQYSIADSEARQAARALASQSDLVSWDTQGRIRIKDALLEYGGISQQCALVGAFRSFEIWDPEVLAKVGGIGMADMKAAVSKIGM